MYRQPEEGPGQRGEESVTCGGRKGGGPDQTRGEAPADRNGAQCTEDRPAKREGGPGEQDGSLGFIPQCVHVLIGFLIMSL